ncbi:cobalt ECF transporter T component CbiQ [bacterium]|nr:cobalt ECF transporter T component CbiQ [bacterium]
MDQLPEWMLPQSTPDQWRTLPDGLPQKSARPPRRSAARSAVREMITLVSGMLTDDATAARRGLLQSIDTRFKTLGLIGILVASTFMHSLVPLAICYLMCITLAAASRVSARRFLGVLLVVPFFSLVIVLPATLNIVTQGHPVWTIWRTDGMHLGPWQLPCMLAVTDSGLFIASRFVLRTAVCVSLVVLLTSTTRWSYLFHGLRALGVPQLFVAVLNMMQRYLDVLIRSAEQIHLAKISRSITSRSTRQEQSWVAAGIGALFRRTYRLSGQVYLAMLSRGYTGEVKLLDSPRSHIRDWVFLFLAAALVALLLRF